MFRFSFFLLIWSALNHAALVTISYVNLEQAQSVQEILEEKYAIPNSLIKLEAIKECPQAYDNVLHICLSQNGEMEILNAKTEVLRKSFSVFKQDKKE